MNPAEEFSYGSYLKIPELLSLQKTRSDQHDEMQFIVVHQVFELWFRLVLHELEAIRAALFGKDAERATHLLGRVNELLRIAAGQFDVIETMRPYDFLKFREVLKPASGFQSVQFREIEYIAGLKDARFLSLFAGDPSVERLRRRLSEPSLWDAFLAHLDGRGLASAPEAALKKTLATIERGQAGNPLLLLSHALIEFDERVSVWRARHIQMTERMIGGRPGTGEKLFQKLAASGYSVMGSGGVHYLETTLHKRFFPLLWDLRSELEP
ncbi:MAG: tryptophan 2,3-dioxygenase [Planctomycetes bacterium]|nr:tryptophan 2,3-dioxygenase [Planctomycetota bacterium]